jgi:hypothetical protein
MIVSTFWVDGVFAPGLGAAGVLFLLYGSFALHLDILDKR